MADLGHIDPAFQQKLNALIAASGGKVSVGNSYRSTARQQQLFDAAVKKYGSEAAARKWVAKPGHSKHQEGIAADLKGDLAWAHAHAAQFGLYFPMGHEPWHVEITGSRNTKESRTEAPTSVAPGNPDALDALGAERPEHYGTIEGQLANLMAAITTPTDRAF